MGGLMRGVDQPRGGVADYGGTVDTAAATLAAAIVGAPQAGLPDWLCRPLTRAVMAAGGAARRALAALLRGTATASGVRRTA